MAISVQRLMARQLARAGYGRIRWQQISVVPDPTVPDVYAVRVRRRYGADDFLVRANGPLGLATTYIEVDEVEFTCWPPRTR